MGMSKLGRYAYSMIDGATANNTFLVWMKLRGVFCAPRFFFCLLPPPTVYARLTHTTITEGYDPNGNYVGITAMQVAVENANADMFLVLLKFGADPKMKTASRSRGKHTNTPKYFLPRTCARA